MGLGVGVALPVQLSFVGAITSSDEVFCNGEVQQESLSVARIVAFGLGAQYGCSVTPFVHLPCCHRAEKSLSN
jgi:hypothetical protein